MRQYPYSLIRVKVAPLAGVVMVCVVAGALAAGCEKESGGASSVKTPVVAMPVHVAAVRRDTFEVRARAIGWVEAYSTVVVRPQIDGMIEAVHFSEGQDIKAGDLLFSIDARPFESALELAKANLERVKVQAEHLARDAARVQKLFDKGQAAEREFDQMLTSARAMAAEMGARQADVDRANLELEYCKICSPIDGRAGRFLVNPGNTVKRNEADLVEIKQVAPIYVRFSLPEASLKLIRAAADRQTEVTMQISGSSDRDVGRLTFIDNAVDRETGMVLLKATFDNASLHLWPGSYGDVEMVVETLNDVVLVPTEAVQAGQRQPFVFVVKADHTVECRDVTCGEANTRVTVITDGLSGDETVVTDGQLRLAQGTEISIQNEAVGDESSASQPSAAGSGE